MMVDEKGDLQVTGQQFAKHVDRPTFQRLRQHRVVRVCKRAHCYVPRLLHISTSTYLILALTLRLIRANFQIYLNILDFSVLIKYKGRPKVI